MGLEVFTCHILDSLIRQILCGIAGRKIGDRSWDDG